MFYKIKRKLNIIAAILELHHDVLLFVCASLLEFDGEPARISAAKLDLTRKYINELKHL